MYESNPEQPEPKTGTNGRARRRSPVIHRRRALFIWVCAILLAMAVPVSVHAAAQARTTSNAAPKTTSEQQPPPPAVALSLPTTAPSAQGVTAADSIDDPTLEREINDVIDAYPEYQIGVALLDVTAGGEDKEVHQYGVKKPFEAASTAKVLAAAAYFHLVESGAASLDEPLGAYPASFQLQAMIQQSDNDSWSLIMDAIGFQELSDYADSLGVQYDPETNTLTPADMARILGQLYSGSLLNAEDTTQLLSTMQNTNDETLIPAAVPADVTVYHKYGELGGELHDAAILEKGGHSYALVIYTKGEDLGSATERTDIIHKVTQLVVDALLQ
ncbi:metallo-hydrolase family protein [Paenarthrobacter sp. JL.01a]|uniref:metallo-hydrolase family protein n=1 Tax=Paenarthrobacter sp. JL.01a TaxID=2979324 RepID=UPI0021C944DE|nr:metallo-hydrolase family protein [Paenarthrobacter sp. JL.01a]UXM93559.1 metallo-hydrolase family protein [Paenarthrobacter sp. JL.01a]